MESQKNYRAEIGAEFFPQKTEEGKINLGKNRIELARLNPSCISVTSSICDSIREAIFVILAELRPPTEPHIFYFDQIEEQSIRHVQNYNDYGVDPIVVFRDNILLGCV